MMVYDITIIGAGFSGLSAASILLKKDPKLNICIIDSNTNIGAKIKVSGGGKCNITNKYLNSGNYLGDQKFIQAILDTYDQNDFLKFLSQNSIYPNLNEKIVKGTYFCNSSSDVIHMFKLLIKKAHLKLNTKVQSVEFNNNFLIKTNTTTINSHKLVVATGGLSYPILGASDIGYNIAQYFNHNIIKPSPALVGFTVQKDQFWFKELSGLSLKVKIKIEDKVIIGDMLFTHKGCSGPAVLTTSLYWKKGLITIDFAPFEDSYLPKRFKKAIKSLDINIHKYSFAPAGNFGYTKAEVTRGGVDTNELKENLESKLQPNLYFIGEVVDVTGELGGYNFQWCFSSASKIVDTLTF